jgi:hypothetical protein
LNLLSSSFSNKWSASEFFLRWEIWIKCFNVFGSSFEFVFRRSLAVNRFRLSMFPVQKFPTDRFTCEISIQMQTPCDQNSRGCSPKTAAKKTQQNRNWFLSMAPCWNVLLCCVEVFP